MSPNKVHNESDMILNDIDRIDPHYYSFSTRYQFTGREFDSFSGLQYSRARFYDPQIGRFISEDPIGFGGRDVNLYGYVGNHPTMFADPFGLFPSLWPFDYHQNSVRRGLRGIASPDQIDALNDGLGDYDWGTKDPAYSPLHAMSRPGQSPENARRESNASIRRHVCLARKMKAMGLEGQALPWLQRAVHTLQDAASPAHYDFQPGGGNFLTDIEHFLKENFDPKNGIAADAARRVWDYYNNGKMPRDFFPDALDTRGGVLFYPMNTPVAPDGGCGCE